jgi:dTDP-4-amino-4,6-dideoxygalactose transaminase
MSVAFLDLKPLHDEISGDLDAAWRRVMESGWYVLGPEVDTFEKEFAAYCGATHCVGVGNGLEALHLILRAMGVGPGDEVLVPSNTYIATWLAATHAGATPVPVEPDPQTHNIDPARIAAAVTARTRAIIAVHLYGRPADMDPIREVAARYGLKVVEDAAQAHGAVYRGRRTGALADAAGFSFYPTKNLGCIGDGGAVVTDDSLVAERVRLLRNYGSPRKNVNEIAGFNSRLDPLQAALLRVKLARLDGWNRRRDEIAAAYRAGLSNLPGLTVPEPSGTDWMHVWHLYVVRHAEREALQRHLERAGIGTMIHYPIAPHRSAAYASLGLSKGLPIAAALADEVLSLPMGAHIGESEVAEVIAAMRTFCLQ